MRKLEQKPGKLDDALNIYTNNQTCHRPKTKKKLRSSDLADQSLKLGDEFGASFDVINISAKDELRLLGGLEQN